MLQVYHTLTVLGNIDIKIGYADITITLYFYNIKNLWNSSKKNYGSQKKACKTQTMLFLFSKVNAEHIISHLSSRIP